MKNKLNVATTIILDKQDILILQRGPESSGSGTWNFPGGKVEEDEDPMDAAIREVKEETGLIIEKDKIDYLGSLILEHIVVNTFITNSYSGTVKINKESMNFKWVSILEIPEYPFVGGGSLHSDILKNIMLYLNRKK
jgi:8-oxo-dGTP diphosphatase